MANEEKDGTKLIQFGKYSGVMFPEIYHKFVFKLYNEHDDLVRAMVLAKVSLKDGSARDFLNGIFETAVTKEMSMEIGFRIFYDALERRRNTISANQEVERVAKEFAKPSEHGYRFRPEEDAGKPLFPSIEEQEDRGDK